MQVIDSEIYEKNPILIERPTPDTELKNWLIEYVGNRCLTGPGDVTVEMIVQTVSEEFPEFLMAVAEENFFRGYEQALADFQEAEDLEDE
tara:strand:- start:171 stop:440 length:270 start_codon:yes stop_codon:yes gene_type:complete